jgi:hypothetical protein
MSCKNWQDDDYQWPAVAQPKAALDYAPAAQAPPATTAPPFQGQLFYVGPIANAAETVIASTQAQGPSTACTVYINGLSDSHYNSASVKFYAIIGGLRTQVGATATMPSSTTSASQVFTVAGYAADYYEVTLTPGSGGATAQLAVAIVGFGREAFGIGATGSSSGTITLAGDLGGTAASPTVVGVTGTTGTLAVHATTLAWDSTVTGPTIDQLGTGPSGGTAQALTVSPQAANAGGNSVAGSVEVKLGGPSGSGAEAHLAVWTATHQFFLTKADDTNGYSQPYIYLGSPATAPTTSNYSLFCDSSQTIVNCPSAGDNVSLAVSATKILSVDNATVKPQVAAFTWPASVALPKVSQTAQSTDVATNNLTLAPQGSYASATAGNRFGGSVVVNKALATNGATATDYGGLIVQYGGSTAVTIGTYQEAAGYGAIYFGTAAPSSTNFGFLGNATQTYLNVPSGGQLNLSFAGTSVNGVNITQTLFTLATCVTVQWASGIASPVINQAAASGNGQTMRHSAQSSNAANGNGGILQLTGGDLNGSGLPGGVQLCAGAASPESMVEVAEVVLGNTIVALCFGATVTSTQMPANTGDGVVFLANAVANPSANAVSGGILYGNAGAGTWRGSGGTTSAFGPA